MVPNHSDAPFLARRGGAERHEVSENGADRAFRNGATVGVVYPFDISCQKYSDGPKFDLKRPHLGFYRTRQSLHNFVTICDADRRRHHATD